MLAPHESDVYAHVPVHRRAVQADIHGKSGTSPRRVLRAAVKTRLHATVSTALTPPSGTNLIRAVRVLECLKDLCDLLLGRPRRHLVVCLTQECVEGSDWQVWEICGWPSRSLTLSTT